MRPRGNPAVPARRHPPASERDDLIAGALGGGRVWGRFDVEILGRHAMLPVVAPLMNLRSRLTGIATGDQAIFVLGRAFREIGGYPDIPLMEDIALSKRLKSWAVPRACASG